MKRAKKIPRDDQWSEGDIRRGLTNIFHVSCGTIPSFLWVASIVRLIEEYGAENTIRETTRSFNESVESLGQFSEAINEDKYVERFLGFHNQTPPQLAQALLNDLLPRAMKWSGT
jgi:hypothetical protein